ncbi:hypothetical protein O988_09414 [Pseudogymnoascus sp. VKM F-3808]|nr:hypothetical protein O988_09414 [Pseudogymnoascus sp. VKM F-3808]
MKGQFLHGLLNSLHVTGEGLEASKFCLGLKVIAPGHVCAVWKPMLSQCELTTCHLSNLKSPVHPEGADGPLAEKIADSHLDIDAKIKEVDVGRQSPGVVELLLRK